ncbi:hypothetical protein PENDEC_c014G04845 [Penicillium decumbens]|uniref:Uncharacterized protein n=1 Tax=Penicillium decumbens TaxID=69771 RepID=A0A1V6P9P0_PENDC|nr:hypothetical protein PENDEC_c014G04845 [Penicillium decumbens]
MSSMTLSRQPRSDVVVPQVQWPLGNLHVFPLEVIWQIFDDLLMGGRDGRLTHKGLCAFRQISAINEQAAELVRTYIERQIPSEYLKEQIAAPWCPYLPAAIPQSYKEIVEIAALNNPPKGYDIVTDTIRDDCVECFSWLSETTTVPNDHTHGCNEGGWSYVAIAACANSFRMLEAFCTTSPYGSAITHLASPANHNCVEVSPLDIMARRQDLHFFERLIDLLLTRFPDPEVTALMKQGLSRQSMIELCKFATPELAAKLHSVGIEICNSFTLNSSSWHAGVINSPAFLDYLRQNSILSVNGAPRCRNTPLFDAVNADRLDSVQWLLWHDADIHLSRTKDPRCTPLHLAATKCSDASEAILEKLLSASRLGRPSTPDLGMLLYSLVEGLVLTCLHEAVRSDIDHDGYMFLRNVHEDRAIRKCGLIWGINAAIRRARPGSEPYCVDPCLWFAKAKRLALTAGFVRIVFPMKRCSAYFLEDYMSASRCQPRLPIDG